MKCKVCGKYFTPKKDAVYQVCETTGGLINAVLKVFDAIDCPRCGCQRVLGVRMSPFVPARKDD